MLEFLLIIVFLAFVTGIIGVFKGKLNFLKIKTRKQSAIIIGVSFLLMIVISPFIEADSNDLNQAGQTNPAQNVLINNDDNSSNNNATNNNENFETNRSEQENSNNDNTKDEIDRKESQSKQSNNNKKRPSLKVHFINVGQADAALITFSDKAILIDSGDWRGNEVVNYLKKEQINKLDLIVGSHPHADHIGQIDKVINNFEVDEVWLDGNVATSQVFERIINAIDSKGIGYDEPRAGDQYEIDNLSIDIISPQSLTGNLNNDSIVMKLTYGQISFLFTGDIEQSAESSILRRGMNLKSTVLKVAHHGSDTSSTKGFVDAVNPEVAIISVGKNNSYGHPSDTIIKRFKNNNVQLYATKDHGTIIVETDGNSYHITTNRKGNVTPASANNPPKKKQNKQASTSKQNKQTSTGKETNQKSTESTSKSKEKPTKPSNDQAGKQCVDINRASYEEVQAIIHIGPERAKDLIDNRPYNSVDNLTKINGIGPARIKDIKAEGKACVK